MSDDSVKVTLTGDAASLLRMFSDTAAGADKAAASTSAAFAGAGADMAAEFSAATDKMKEAIDSLAVESDVDADAMKAKLISAMLEVEAAAERVRAENAKPMFGPTAKDAERVAQAMADAEDEARDMNAEFDKTRAAADDAGAGVDDLSGKLDKAKKSSGDAKDGMGGMMKAAEALLPALVTFGGVGAGAVAGIAMASGLAALGIGAFALAASGDMAGVETKAKAMLATFQEANAPVVLPVLNGALALLPKIFDDLSPLVSTTAHALQGLETDVAGALGSPYWASFDKLLAGQAGGAVRTFGDLLGGTVKAMAGLDEAFAPLIGDIEHGLDGWATSMGNFGATATGNKGLGAFVDYVEKEGPAVLHTIGLLGSDITTLAEDAGKIGPSFLSVIDMVAILVGDAERLSPKLVEVGLALLAVYRATKTLSPALGVLKDASNLSALFNGLKTGSVEASSGLGKAVQAAGNFQRSLTTTGTAADSTKAPIAAVGTAATTAATEVETAGASIGTSATTAAAEVDAAGTDSGVGFRQFSVGADGAATEVTAASAEIVAGADAAAEGVEVAGVEADAAGEAIGIGLDAALGPIGLVAIALTALIPLFHHTSSAASAAGSAAASSFSDAVGDSIPKMSTELQVLTAQHTALQAATTKTTMIGTRFGMETRTSSDASRAQTKTLQNQAAEMGGLTSKIKDATNKQEGLEQASALSATGLSATAQAAAAAAAPAAHLATEFAAITTAEDATSQSLTNLTAAMNIFTGDAAGTADAQENVVQGFATMAAALKANKGALDGNSDAAVADRAAIGDQATAIDTAVSAMAKQGDSVQTINTYWAQNVSHLKAAIIAAGGTTAQANAMATQFGLTGDALKVYDDQAVHTAGSNATLKAREIDAATAAAQLKTATDNAQTSIGKFGSAASTAGGDLQGNSKASQAARTNAAAFSDTLFNHVIPALLENGDTAGQAALTTQGLIGKFDAAATQSGLTAGQVQALNKQYGLVPKTITTVISANTGPAQTALTTFLDGVPKTVTIGVGLNPTSSVTPTGQITHHAAGGIVTHPELSWIAEAGYPEAVVPLKDGMSKAAIAGSIQQFFGTHLGGGVAGLGSGIGVAGPAGTGSTDSGLGLAGLSGVTLATKLAPTAAEGAAHAAAIKAEQALQAKTVGQLSARAVIDAKAAQADQTKIGQVSATDAARIAAISARTEKLNNQDAVRQARDATAAYSRVHAVTARDKQEAPKRYVGESAKAWAAAQAAAAARDKKGAAENKKTMADLAKQQAELAAEQASRSEKAAAEEKRIAAEQAKSVAALAKDRDRYELLMKQTQAMIEALSKVNIARDASNTNIHVVAQTAADSAQIAKDIAWAMKTGV